MKTNIIWKVIIFLFIILSILGRATRSMHTMEVGEQHKIESQLED